MTDSLDHLCTERCLLKPIEAEDRENMGELYLNDAVRSFLGGALEYREFVSRFSALLVDCSAMTWTIHLRKTSAFIGAVGISTHHDGAHQEISYQLLPQFWGHGYAAEAVRSVMRYAFEVMKLGTLVAETQARNLPSRRLLEAVGMQAIQEVSRFGEQQILYWCELTP